MGGRGSSSGNGSANKSTANSERAGVSATADQHAIGVNRSSQAYRYEAAEAESIIMEDERLAPTALRMRERQLDRTIEDWEEMGRTTQEQAQRAIDQKAAINDVRRRFGIR